MECLLWPDSVPIGVDDTSSAPFGSDKLAIDRVKAQGQRRWWCHWARIDSPPLRQVRANHVAGLIVLGLIYVKWTISRDLPEHTAAAGREGLAPVRSIQSGVPARTAAGFN